MIVPASKRDAIYKWMDGYLKGGLGKLWIEKTNFKYLIKSKLCTNPLIVIKTASSEYSWYEIASIFLLFFFPCLGDPARF